MIFLLHWEKSPRLSIIAIYHKEKMGSEKKCSLQEWTIIGAIFAFLKDVDIV